MFRVRIHKLGLRDDAAQPNWTDLAGIHKPLRKAWVSEFIPLGWVRGKPPSWEHVTSVQPGTNNRRWLWFCISVPRSLRIGVPFHISCGGVRLPFAESFRVVFSGGAKQQGTCTRAALQLISRLPMLMCRLYRRASIPWTPPTVCRLLVCVRLCACVPVCPYAPISLRVWPAPEHELRLAFAVSPPLLPSVPLDLSHR